MTLTILDDIDALWYVLSIDLAIFSAFLRISFNICSTLNSTVEGKLILTIVPLKYLFFQISQRRALHPGTVTPCFIGKVSALTRPVI